MKSDDCFEFTNTTIAPADMDTSCSSKDAAAIFDLSERVVNAKNKLSVFLGCQLSDEKKLEVA